MIRSKKQNSENYKMNSVAPQEDSSGLDDSQISKGNHPQPWNNGRGKHLTNSTIQWPSFIHEKYIKSNEGLKKKKTMMPSPKHSLY